ncbi:MAG: hypothetical protein IJT95_04735 [Abditibacteriota bacterium]|nr:hypothetical protein [Abditibacteriota bacterium]
MTDAWVDGSFRSQEAGWAFVVLDGGNYIYEDCGSDVPAEFLAHRNVAGEIYAVLRLLDFCRENGITQIRVHHDYTGLQAWAEGTFKANTVLTKYYKKYVADSGVSIEWIKSEGHSGETWNEYADKLAKFAIGILKEPPALPEPEEQAAPEPAPEEELDESIDISALKHIDLRKLLEEKQSSQAGGSLPQPVQSIPQMAYSGEEASLGREEAFARARSLEEDGRFPEACELLKPFMNKNLSDSEIAFYLHCMSDCGSEQAEKAVSKAEMLLEQRPGSKMINRELCTALYKARIVPAVTALSLTGALYSGGREACIRLLEISSASPTILDMILPFMRLAKSVGDRELLARIGRAADPGIISDAGVKIGSATYSKRREFTSLVRQDQ